MKAAWADGVVRHLVTPIAAARLCLLPACYVLPRATVADQPTRIYDNCSSPFSQVTGLSTFAFTALTSFVAGTQSALNPLARTCCFCVCVAAVADAPLRCCARAVCCFSADRALYCVLLVDRIFTIFTGSLYNTALLRVLCLLAACCCCFDGAAGAGCCVFCVPVCAAFHACMGSTPGLALG